MLYILYIYIYIDIYIYHFVVFWSVHEYVCMYDCLTYNFCDTLLFWNTCSCDLIL